MNATAATRRGPALGLNAASPGIAWRWWLRALVAWLPSRWRTLLSLTPARLLLQRSGHDWQLRLAQDGELRELALLPASPDTDMATVLDAALRPSARELPRWLLLPAASGLRRVLELPAAASTRLREVVGFEIERQTPFAAADVLYDARLLGPAMREGHVRAELAVVPANAVQAQLDALGGLPLAGIDLADSDGMPLEMNLLPLAQRASRSDPLRPLHLLLAAAALVLGCLLLWQLLDNRRAAADALDARVSLLAEQARAASVQRQQLVDLVEGQSFLDRSRQARPTMIEIIEDLSRRLPDGTSLERLAIEGTRLSLTGHSSQAAAVVGQMEGSPLWRSPALTGALQADARTRRDRFALIAELVVDTAVAPVEAAHAQ